MSEFQAITTEWLLSGQHYEYVDPQPGDELPRVQMWREREKQPSGIVISARIRPNEYVQIRPDNGAMYGTGQIAK